MHGFIALRPTEAFVPGGKVHVAGWPCVPQAQVAAAVPAATGTAQGAARAAAAASAAHSAYAQGGERRGVRMGPEPTEHLY